MGPLAARPPAADFARRAAVAAWAVAAMLAGAVALVLAVAAERGFALCGRRLAVSADGPMTMMHGTAMLHQMGAHAVASHAGVCPIVLYAALVAAGLTLAAIVACAGARIGPCAATSAFARLVARAGTPRVGTVATAAGVAPLVAFAAMSPATFAAVPAAVMAVVLAVCAFAASHVLVSAARAVVHAGRRLVAALLAFVRLLVAPPPRLAVARLRPHASSAVRARRRPSRAPPRRA